MSVFFTPSLACWFCKMFDKYFCYHFSKKISYFVITYITIKCLTKGQSVQVSARWAPQLTEIPLIKKLTMPWTELGGGKISFKDIHLPFLPTHPSVLLLDDIALHSHSPLHQRYLAAFIFYLYLASKKRKGDFMLVFFILFKLSRGAIMILA